MLDGVRATHTHPSTRGTPSVQAPCEVRVHVHAEASSFVLPRKVVDPTGARDQVPGQPDQRRP
eukprot:3766319-Alexandrium_andersonii.AAC.1